MDLSYFLEDKKSCDEGHRDYPHRLFDKARAKAAAAFFAKRTAVCSSASSELTKTRFLPV